jgi:hypothetical protein
MEDIPDEMVRKMDEQDPGENLTSTKYTLGHLKGWSRVELIEEILGTHSWDYLLENNLVEMRHAMVLAKKSEEYGLALKIGNKYRYTVYPWPGTYTAVLEFNEDEREYVLQTYGDDREYWNSEGMATFCMLYSADSIEADEEE